MKKAFPWLQKKDKPRQPGKLVIAGEKVVLRKKRIEDAEDDYAWRTDEELARLDATKPLRMDVQRLPTVLQGGARLLLPVVEATGDRHP